MSEGKVANWQKWTLEYSEEGSLVVWWGWWGVPQSNHLISPLEFLIF